MDEAFEESKAKADLAKKKEAASLGIFESQIEHGCGHNQTIIAKRGLPTSGKLERLKRLAGVKRIGFL